MREQFRPTYAALLRGSKLSNGRDDRWRDSTSRIDPITSAFGESMNFSRNAAKMIHF
ncbi:hypothetical protein [Burkholderia sp. Ac-20353]|uniref:hypothetical protein n=1 Tax=Burkholderia sp. Ac-20353 TaxID=2703894 RepID=UPI00197CB220|nr:hypothetical protein [Burkholderia sp. Ac-20353]MBN3789618.1 hypothetical protein [Burkholderia sp. Ac-20353]